MRITSVPESTERELAGCIVRFSEDIRKAYGEYSRHLDGDRLRGELAELHRLFAHELIDLIEEDAERRRGARNAAARGRRIPGARRDG